MLSLSFVSFYGGPTYESYYNQTFPNGQKNSPWAAGRNDVAVAEGDYWGEEA
jgi:hypothetical protein